MEEDQRSENLSEPTDLETDVYGCPLVRHPPQDGLGIFFVCETGVERLLVNLLTPSLRCWAFVLVRGSGRP